MTNEELAELERLLDEATPGPYDHNSSGLIRAIRGSLAVPIFEPRLPYGDFEKGAPTVRQAGEVVARANSLTARDIAAHNAEQANIKAFTALLNAAPSLIATAREAEALRAENARLREVNARLSEQVSRFSIGDALMPTLGDQLSAALEQGEVK